jgi:hypothetical protein
MRLIVAATCIRLSACTQFADLLAPTGGAQQTSETEESETCARSSELAVGMTPSQVLSSCERRPLRTSDIITREGKLDTIWVYRGNYLHFAGGKLERIQPAQ